MDDNELCHRPVLMDDFQDSEDIQLMHWPSFPPGFKPVQHVQSDTVGRRHAALPNLLSSVPELKRTIITFRSL